MSIKDLNSSILESMELLPNLSTLCRIIILESALTIPLFPQLILICSSSFPNKSHSLGLFLVFAFVVNIKRFSTNKNKYFRVYEPHIDREKAIGQPYDGLRRQGELSIANFGQVREKIGCGWGVCSVFQILFLKIIFMESTISKGIFMS